MVVKRQWGKILKIPVLFQLDLPGMVQEFLLMLKVIAKQWVILVLESRGDFVHQYEEHLVYLPISWLIKINQHRIW